jgi:hypothetical protein
MRRGAPGVPILGALPPGSARSWRVSEAPSAPMDKKIVVPHRRSPVFLGRDCPTPEGSHRSAAVTGWPQATRRVEERAKRVSNGAP